MTDNEQRAKWRADEQRWRKVITLCVAILSATGVHLGAGIWWASGINERMATVESRHDRLQERSDVRSERQDARLSLLQAELQADRVTTARQEQKLEQVITLLEEMRQDIRRTMLQQSQPR